MYAAVDTVYYTSCIAIAFALQATGFGFDSLLGLDAFYKTVMLRVKA